MSDREWMVQAECRNHGLDVMFPMPRDRRGRSRALQICMGCPVFDECHRYTRDTNPSHGVWAGQYINRKNFRSNTVRDSRCGTERGYQAHWRRDEKACNPCLRAHELYNAEQYERRKARL